MGVGDDRGAAALSVIPRSRKLWLARLCRDIARLFQFYFFLFLPCFEKEQRCFLPRKIKKKIWISSCFHTFDHKITSSLFQGLVKRAIFSVSNHPKCEAAFPSWNRFLSPLGNYTFSSFLKKLGKYQIGRNHRSKNNLETGLRSSVSNGNAA